MHIHGNPINSNVASLHSAAGAHEAAAAQRAAETRKKLAKSAVKIEGELDDPEASFMISQWSDEGSRQRQSENHDHVPMKPQIDEEQADTPVSIWA